MNDKRKDRRSGNVVTGSGTGAVSIGGDASEANNNVNIDMSDRGVSPDPAIPTSTGEVADAARRGKIESAAKSWDFRVVVSADLAGAGARFSQISDGLGAEGGRVFQNQVRRFIDYAFDAANGQEDEGVWQWTGDGALLAFADATRANQFAMALHGAAETHNRGAQSPEAERHFRVGIAATDDPQRESWDYTVMRAVRLESNADTDGILVDVGTWAGLHSSKRALYGNMVEIHGKRDDEIYVAYLFGKGR